MDSMELEAPITGAALFRHILGEQAEQFSARDRSHVYVYAKHTGELGVPVLLKLKTGQLTLAKIEDKLNEWSGKK